MCERGQYRMTLGYVEGPSTHQTQEVMREVEVAKKKEKAKKHKPDQRVNKRKSSFSFIIWLEVKTMETPCSLVDGRGNLYNFDLEESDIWLPYSYRNELLKSVLLYMSTLTAMLFLVMSIFIIKGRSSKSEKEIKTVFKDSAQIINIIFNLIISSMGKYIISGIYLIYHIDQIILLTHSIFVTTNL